MDRVEVLLAEAKKKYAFGYWAERFIAEMQYLREISKLQKDRLDGQIAEQLEAVLKSARQDGAIVKASVLNAEHSLASLEKEAKKYTLNCIGHAHIDMNWMWRWDETVGIALETFRTVLDLMQEYPAFTFGQSQASVYKIVETYAPAMLDEIKFRIEQGQWEVLASHWVEADKNMPSEESFARHLLYTRKYMTNLLGLDPQSLDIDFEPDTFGHSLHVPEILASGGVKYYYHCRGGQEHVLYRWFAPSGRSVLVMQEPYGYNNVIRADFGVCVPAFCAKHGLDNMLRIYGVGDHGGGPTRKDLAMFTDMASWPLYPQTTFGTFKKFFKDAEVREKKTKLPEIKIERNFIFTGCYTSQSRVKKANRLGEAALQESEALCTFASLFGQAPAPDRTMFETGWTNILFNQFHDILPGSHIMDTREYAMGRFQDTLAITSSQKILAMRAIANHVNTSAWIEEPGNLLESESEGAGVGFGIDDFKISQTGRGQGPTRVFLVFNPSTFNREENTEFVVWDWHYDLRRISFQDSEGKPVTHQLLTSDQTNYWGHKFIRVLVKVKVPACGYNTYILKEKPAQAQPIKSSLEDPLNNGLREFPDTFVLENKHLKAVFSVQNASLVSLLDKTTGEQMTDSANVTGVFRLVEEDACKGMSAWFTGRYMNVHPLVENIKMSSIPEAKGPLRQSFYYEVNFGRSKLKATVSLDDNQPRLHYGVEVDWLEVGKPNDRIPQLSFYLGLPYPCTQYQYGVPMGTLVREPMDMEMPSLGWAMALRKEKSKTRLMLSSDTKYGYRGDGKSLAVCLIRGSFDPDPFPELGQHRFNLSVCLVRPCANNELLDQTIDSYRTLTVFSSTAHKGTLPASNSFFSLDKGTVRISSIKNADHGFGALVVRMFECEGKKTRVQISFAKPVKKAYALDVHEQKTGEELGIKFQGDMVVLDVPAYRLVNLGVEF